MARSSSRTLLIVVVVIAVAIALRWAGGDWIWSQVASLHGPRGH